MIHDRTMLLVLRAQTRLRSLREERGDVPGWVLITVMSALLMIGLLGVAEGKLEELLNKAFESVSDRQDN